MSFRGAVAVVFWRICAVLGWNVIKVDLTSEYTGDPGEWKISE